MDFVGSIQHSFPHTFIPEFPMIRLLLLGHSDGASTTTGRLRVLSSDTQTPIVAHTSMGADLLQALQVLAQLRVQIGGCQLGVLAVNDVLLSVEEPVRDLVLQWILDDRHQLLNLREH